MTTVIRKYVGMGCRRAEDPRLLQGRGQYVDDLRLPNMVHVAFVRSLHAHARITVPDHSQTRAVPGVIAMVTARDLQGVKPLRADESDLPEYRVTEWPPLARHKVRFVGEAVAAVAATDPAVAEDAADQFPIGYEPLPPVLTIAEAAQPDAPRVHDEWPNNVLMRATGSGGDVAAAFRRAAITFTETFTSEGVTGVPIEPRGCLAALDPGTGVLCLWTSHQVPHILRTLLAEHLGHPEHLLRVVAPDLGGGFGIKSHLYPEELVVASLALQLQRPVKWTQSRREDFLSNVYCRDSRVTLEMAASSDGVVLGMRARSVTNSGAYSILPFGAAHEATGAARQIPGPYRIRDYEYEAVAVVSNKPPRGAYRGVAMVTTTFCMERMLDLLATRLGLDPVEVRRRNLIGDDELPFVNALGVSFEATSFRRSLEEGVRAIGYDAFRARQKAARGTGPLIGLGIACYAEFTAPSATALRARGVRSVPGFDAATIRVSPTGTIQVFTSVTTMGQGLPTALAQLVADECGVRMEDVLVQCGDSSLAPYGSGSWGSRGAVAGGGVVLRAARQIRDKVLAIAAHRLEATVADLVCEDRRIWVRGAPFRSVTFGELAAQANMMTTRLLPEGMEPGLEATACYDPPSVTVSNGTHLAVVEIDPDTGVFGLRRYLVVHDCGTIINPLLVEGQIHGGCAQGAGQVLGEAARYDPAGQLLTGSLLDYPIPRATDLPPQFEIVHLETPAPTTHAGIKGMGEGGTIGAVAAVANAVADALRSAGADGVRSVPVLPEHVLTALGQGPR
ncbi:MAG: carbon monoxide dehydrogenase [Candidatus Rokuibacteriota bacterium]|nr:MAG: carbon monoxide dehydrogenase [Candidatus Rokubacteria bacterium]